MKIIGKKTIRVDGQSLVKGKPVFADDIKLDNPLYIKILHSPVAHAKIKNIDTSKAMAMDGVVAVYTHKDFKKHYYTTAGQGYPEPSPRDYRILDDTVRFVGDNVAFVSAESVDIAEKALEAIKVEYNPLPANFDDTKAMESPQMHPSDGPTGIHDVKKNIAANLRAEVGNTTQALKKADFVFSKEYSTPFVQHAHIEPHITLTWLDENDRLVIRTATQVPFHVRRIVAEVLDFPMRKIRVIKPRVGGAFGGKQEIMIEDICAAVTLKTGRPARLEYTREEEFYASRSRHPQKVKLTFGLNKKHEFVALEMDILENCGAYGPHALTVMSVTAQKTLSLYRCPNIKLEANAVYTNLPIAGAYRGYGAPQGFFPLESIIDEMANDLNIDPIELRKKNHVQLGDDIPIGKIIGEGGDGFPVIVRSMGLDECLDEGKKLIGWDKIKSEKQKGIIRRGVGVAAAGQGSGIPGIDMGAAFIKMNEDASFNLLAGATDLGTGSDTMLAQIAAETLEVSVDSIIVYTSDTDITPFDTGAYASSGTYVSGTAVKKAAEKVKAQILDIGMKILGVKKAEIRDGWVIAPTSRGGKKISYSDICTKAMYTDEQQQIMAEASHMSYDSPSPYNATFADVSVDTETGIVKVNKVVSVTDIGQVINPQMSEGQVEGAIPQSLGMALTEFMIFDDKGAPINTDFNNYHIYTAIDMPEIVTKFVNTHEPTGPYGAKAVAEIPINGPAPAVANAVFNAVGVRIRNLPITAEKVLGGKIL
ncbi:MAG: molybdopterin-dependent oxidoreductase [Planctomycetia bacterium]|nr:molybdopterin-dependent oxidoreductase [Planctomycetia bacterium]